jgi:hypothetical protein
MSKRLKTVQNIILENKKLQEQYPEQKRSLKFTLINLKQLENEILSSKIIK